MGRRGAAHSRRKRRTLLVTAATVTAGLVAGAIAFGTGGGDGTLTATSDEVLSQTVAVQAAAPTPASTPLHQEAPAPIHSIPKSDPDRGMVYTGLTPAAQDDRCVGVYKVSAADLCTHGPDVAPKGVDVAKAVPPVVAAAPAPDLKGGSDVAAPSSTDLLTGTPPVLDAQTGTVLGGSPAAAPTTAAAAAAPAAGTAAAPAAGTAVVCDGDGSTGNRVQVLYVHAPGQDRFGQYQASFKKWAADSDEIYNASAAETGGVRHIRYVTEPDCTVSVLDVELSADALKEFGSTNDALAAQGFKRHDRKYMIFADANVYCGIGTFNGDERPGQDNTSNFGPSYGRTDSGCWSGSTAAHELGHNLGAVNNSAPHSSKAGHCTDEWDLMCYSDAPYYPQMQIRCPNRDQDERLDCNHDDYFNTSPEPGSYLTTHWNIANNQFLIAGGGTGPNPNPSPSPTLKPTGRPTPTATPTPSPTPTTGPTGQLVTVGQITQNSASLSWPQAASASGYDLWVNGRALGTVRGTVVRLTNLRPDTDYKVAIAVRDQSGHAGKPGRATAFHTLSAGGSTLPTGKPYVMVNSLTGQAADLWGGSFNDGTVLIGYQRTGYANQQWLFDDAGTGDGYVRIRSAETDKCLQVGGDLDPGQWVAQQSCGKDAAQQWKVTAKDSGYLLTPKGSDLVLGLSKRWYYGGWLLELQKPDGQAYQNWTVQAAS
ncbi:RICIN domain-containing protein [Kitasatospora sp. NPDC056138]|uniref:RICIN domain-containing protein n=1 Tax=Kitasatospora sp. NPDC056138 TaxID=3345724 RepID=UPI0035D76B1B